MAVRNLALNLTVNFKVATLTRVSRPNPFRNSLCIFKNYQLGAKPIDSHAMCMQKCALFHTSLKKYEAAENKILPAPSKENEKTVSEPIVTEEVKGLMEFFDDEKNWGKDRVKSGRSWTADDLRIKSNTDLHKLWFVLLKERNMLLTMAEVAKTEYELMPNPERIDKVEESMENLETVVKERNRAYYLLETGETGERKVKIVKDGLGLYRRYAELEHPIPQFMNNSFRKKYYFNGRGNAVKKFLGLMREKLYRKKMHVERVQRNNARHLLKRFPDLDDEILQERFPLVDLKKLRYTMS